MEKDALIAMLNRDLADEHAAVIRYLAHGWLEGEDTSLGNSLISISREEMWHMHWLGMIIGMLGGEPDLAPAEYPHDPSSRATLLESYIAYEEKLVPHYQAEAELVSDLHIRRVLLREGWESEIHARKFRRRLEKLSAGEAGGLPRSDPRLSRVLLDRLQREMTDKYTEMLQHVRSSWVFQKDEIYGWELMDQAMLKMKHMALFGESLAEDGRPLEFEAGPVETSANLTDALRKALADVRLAREMHLQLKGDSEFQTHAGMGIKLDLTLRQEEYQEAELAEWLRRPRVSLPE